MDFDPTSFEDESAVNLVNEFEAFEYNSEEDDNNNPKENALNKTATLFAVHITDDLFEMETNIETGYQSSLWSETFTSIAEFMKSKIIAKETDVTGVILFNTRETKNPLNLNGIYLLQDFERPSAERIKFIMDESKRSRQSFDRTYGFARSGDFTMSDLFWTSNQVFAVGAPKSSYKCQMFIFTTNDNPCAPEHRNSTLQRASDLQNFVQLEVFPLQPPNVLDSLSSPVPNFSFDLKKFYRECLQLSGSTQGTNDSLDSYDNNDDEEKAYVEAALCSLDNLRKRVRQKQHMQRKLASLTFKIADNVEIGVSVYTSILAATKPSASKLAKNNRLPLKNETVYVCDNTKKELAPTDIETYMSFGSEFIKLSTAERSTINFFGSPGLTLIGFKPAALLPFSLHSGHGLLIRPDDKNIKNSSVFMAALAKSLTKKGQIGIARLIPRRNSSPRFVAVYPYRNLPETLHEGELSGFSLVPIPYADDIREPIFPSSNMGPAADEEEYEIRLEALKRMKNILRGVRLPQFRPFDIENPSLQMFYGGLEALALGSQQIDNSNADGLVPDEESMQKLKPLCDEFLDLVDPERKMTEGSTAKKRSAPSSNVQQGSDSNEPAAREAKAPSALATLDANGLKNLKDTGKLSSLTIDLLKIYLRERGLSVTGKKADLMERLEKAL